MDQARFLQRVRMNQFKKVYDRWKQKKLTQNRGGRAPSPWEGVTHNRRPQRWWRCTSLQRNAHFTKLSSSAGLKGLFWEEDPGAVDLTASAGNARNRRE